MNILFTFKFLKISVISLVIFVLLDFVWLAVVAAPGYRKALGYLARLDPEGKITFNIPAGLVAQAAISIMLSVVIITCLQLDNRLIVAILTGAFIGCGVYVCYDFTNLSFVKGWPLWISVIDIAWGTVQGVLAGVYVFYLNKYF